MDKYIRAAADDYFSASFEFCDAVDILFEKIAIQERVKAFYLENVVTVNLGHAAELLLKSALGFVGYDILNLKSDFALRHDLCNLADLAKQKGIDLDDKFYLFVQMISDNIRNNDYRYPRVFCGFDESEHEELSNAISQGIHLNDKKVKKKILDAGLVVRSVLPAREFLESIKRQQAIIEKLQSRKIHAANQ